MTAKQIHLIKGTWNITSTLHYLIEKNLLYNRLFVSGDSISPFLVSADTLIINNLCKLENFLNELSKSKTGEIAYSIQTRYYFVTAKALMDTLEKGFNKPRSKEVKEAWTKYYTKLYTAIEEV